MTLRARGLTVRFGARTVLGPLDITIGPGLTALIGRNGAGKTTLLRTLAGLLSPAGGGVLWGGQSLGNPVRLRAFRARLGYVPQDFALYPHLTVTEFVRYAAVMKGVGHRADAACRAALQQLGIMALARRRPAQLSAGQLRLVALAQAIVANPDVLLLDEPLRGLDAETRQFVAGWLQRWASGRSGQRTAIVSAHGTDLDQLDARWVMLDQGRIVCDGPGSEFIHASYGRVWDVLATGPAVSPKLCPGSRPAEALAAVQRQPAVRHGYSLIAVSPRGRDWRLRVVVPPGAGEAALRQWLTEVPGAGLLRVLKAQPLPAGAEAAYLALQADLAPPGNAAPHGDRTRPMDPAPQKDPSPQPDLALSADTASPARAAAETDEGTFATGLP